MWLLLVALLGVCGAVRGSLHCAERRDISPCTCRPMHPASRTIDVMCERMSSFGQVVSALQGRFQPDVQISLKVSYSQLEDLPEHGFQELGLSVSKLTLKDDNLRQLPDTAFLGLNGTGYLNLADNALPAIPTAVLALMPKVRTLDLSRSRLTRVRTDDLQGLPALEHLILASNAISTLEKDSLPRTLKHLHLGGNQLKNLNGTLRELVDVEWLFLNVNLFTTLDGQLPEGGMERLALVFVSNNQLERLPMELRLCPRLENMWAAHNSITHLHGVFGRARKLQLLDLGHNKIQKLAEDDFAEAESVEELQFGYNEIQTLNMSLLPARALQTLNLTFNLLTEFSMMEIRGLQKLKMVDLSHNLIARLSGLVGRENGSETRVEELRLEYNALKSLDGALVGVQGLERLNVSHNLLDSVSPDDLVGLDHLKVLDVSFNRLRTLEETSKTFMPALEELFASHNMLQSLERDFHGLPALCRADLSSNKISRIHPELTTKTRCKVHGVNSVLRISLYDNPVQCDEQLARTLLYFQSNLTELQGVPPCTLAVPHMVLVPVGSLPGVQVPVQVPVQGSVQVPVLPALYPGMAVQGQAIAQAPTLMLPVSNGLGFPVHQLQPLPPTTTTTTTTTTTSTTTTEAPAPPPTEPPATTTAAPMELTVTELETTATTPIEQSTVPPVTTMISTTTSTTTPTPTTTSASTTTTPEPRVEQSMPGPGSGLVLKELPPVIQLLQPEVSVQQSKDLPRLMDPDLLNLVSPPQSATSTTSPSSQPPPPLQPAVEEQPSDVSPEEPPAEPPETDEVPPPPALPPSSTTPLVVAPQLEPALEAGLDAELKAGLEAELEAELEAGLEAGLDAGLEPMSADSPRQVPELPPLIKLLNETVLPVPAPLSTVEAA